MSLTAIIALTALGIGRRRILLPVGSWRSPAH